MLCKYKHIFGKEREGIHAIRFFDVAIIDVILTILGGIVIAKAMKWNVILCIVVLFVIAIIAHRMFCVNTKINTVLFGNIM